jgi:hypothetical protein
MFTASLDGKNIRLVDGYGHTSHFIWRDRRHILAWAKHPSYGFAFYLYEDGTDKVEVREMNGFSTILIPMNKGCNIYICTMS